MKVLRDIATTSMAQIVILPLGIISGILLARALNPTGKGIYALAVLVPGIIVTYCNMGVSSASTYLVGKKKYTFEFVFGNQIILALVLGLFGIILFFIGSPILDQSFRNLPLNFLIVGLILVPISMLEQNLYSDLFLQKLTIYYSLIRITETIINILGLVILTLISKLYPATAVMLISITTVFITLILYLILRKQHTPVLRTNLVFLREMFSYGLKSYVNNLTGSLNYNVDQLIAGALLLPGDLGQYSLAVNIANILWVISDSAKMVLFPSFARYTEREAGVSASTFCRNMLFVTLFGAIGLYMASYFFIPLLYGEAYRPAIVLVWLLLPGVWIFTIVKVVALFWAGQGKPEVNFLPVFIAVAANIPLNILLMPIIGIKAASINSTISYTLAAGLHIFLMVNKAHIPIRNLLLVNHEDFEIYKNLLTRFTYKVRKIFQFA